MITYLIFLSCLVSSYGTKTIDFNENDVTIRGPINIESTNKFFHDTQNLYELKNIKNLNIFINSPGGSVIEGMKILEHIFMLRESNVTVTCISDFSASMAFIILQSCTNRYALSSSVLMQHQMSLSTKNNLYNMHNYLQMINDIDLTMDILQSERIGITIEKFKQLISNDWWLTSNTAKKYNVIDDIIFIKCKSKLYKDTDNLKYSTIFGIITIKYSRCPLLREPLEIDFNNIKTSKINEVNNLYKKSFYVEGMLH